MKLSSSEYTKLLTEANQGDGNAAFSLGCLYRYKFELDDEEIPKNLMSAKFFLEKSLSATPEQSEHNKAIIHYFLAQIYFDGPLDVRHHTKAIEHYRSAIQLNHLDALFELGLIYFNKNLAEGKSLLRQAAEKQHAAANLKLGFYYLFGNSSAHCNDLDVNIAATFLRRAYHFGNNAIKQDVCKAQCHIASNLLNLELQYQTAWIGMAGQTRLPSPISLTWLSRPVWIIHRLITDDLLTLTEKCNYLLSLENRCSSEFSCSLIDFALKKSQETQTDLTLAQTIAEKIGQIYFNEAQQLISVQQPSDSTIQHQIFFRDSFDEAIRILDHIPGTSQHYRQALCIKADLYFSLSQPGSILELDSTAQETLHKEALSCHSKILDYDIKTKIHLLDEAYQELRKAALNGTETNASHDWDKASQKLIDIQVIFKKIQQLRDYFDKPNSIELSADSCRTIEDLQAFCTQSHKSPEEINLLLYSARLRRSSPQATTAQLLQFGKLWSGSAPHTSLTTHILS